MTFWGAPSYHTKFQPNRWRATNTLLDILEKPHLSVNKDVMPWIQASIASIEGWRIEIDWQTDIEGRTHYHKTNQLSYEEATRDAEERKILHHFTSSTGSFRQAHLYNMQVSELEGGSTGRGGFSLHRLRGQIFPNIIISLLAQADAEKEVSP